MFSDELVEQDVPVVVNDFLREASVVEFVTDAATAAGVEEIVDDEAFVIPIVVALAIDDAAARCLLVLEAARAGRSHMFLHLLPTAQYAEGVGSSKEKHL